MKTATTKIAIITYFDIISFITIEISKQNFDDDNNNSDEKNNNLYFQFLISIEKQLNLFLNVANILTLLINSTINIVDISINIAKQINIDIVFFVDFLFRIQRVYKKNKKFFNHYKNLKKIAKKNFNQINQEKHTFKT